MQTPWSSIGYLTYKRTYARETLPGQTEEFPKTIRRCIDAMRTQLKCGFTTEEEARIEEYALSLKALPAGRFLWQLGTGTVDRLGLASLQNCAFRVVDSPVDPFCWAMDMLALGSGVGYNIQRKHVNKIPPVKTWFKSPTRVADAGADFIIPDSREGWVRLLGKTLKSAFLSSDESGGTFSYSSIVIRGKGSPIKGFGGTASGPEDLCWGIGEIGALLERRRGRKLRPIDCLDIMNIIAYIIVAGNVRRSAQIAIGDPDDVEFLLAKRWDIGRVPKWRNMSNNSVACDDINDLHEFFWDSYGQKGEPIGLINLRLAKPVGRTGETWYPDTLVEGFNPCGEQGLEDGETCCLAETFLPRFESFEEFLDALELLYRMCKHSLLLPAHHKKTNDVVHKNMRMGISVSGVLEATEEQLSWLPQAYAALREIDSEYSEKLGVPISIKLTTVKPSGTLSLLPGVLPGCHPGYARYMIRRIRVAADSPLVNVCAEHGCPIEHLLEMDGTVNYGTVVVSFPFAYSERAILSKDMTAFQQMDVIRRLQRDWSDNSVSCTVYFKDHELEGVKEYLRTHYKDGIKTVSFLRHSEHGFKQAPYEEISKEEYLALCAKVKPITSVNSIEFEGSDECASGACPIR